jgi:hypothetical protein
MPNPEVRRTSAQRWLNIGSIARLDSTRFECRRDEKFTALAGCRANQA